MTSENESQETAPGLLEFHTDELVGVVGMTFFWAWMWVLIFFVNSFGIQTRVLPNGSMQLFNFLGMALCFLFLIVMRRYTAFEVRRRWKIILTFFCGCLIVLLSVLSGFELLPAPALIFLWVAEGVASACCLIAIALFISRYEIRTLLVLIATTSLISTVIAIFIAYLQYDAMHVAVSSLLAIAFVCSSLSRHISSAPMPVFVTPATELRELEHPFRRVFVPFLIGMFLCGFVYGYRACVGNLFFAGSAYALPLFGLLLIPELFLIILSLLPGRLYGLMVMQILTAFIAIALMLLLLGGGRGDLLWTICQAAILVLVNCYLLLIIPLQMALAREHGYSPILSFVIGQFLMALGIFGGWLIGIISMDYTMAATPFSDIVIITAISALILSLIAFNRADVNWARRSVKSDTEIMMERCERIAPAVALSHRELEVLKLLVRGATVQEIMDELGVSRNTAKTHMHNVYSKFDVHSKADLANYVRVHS